MRRRPIFQLPGLLVVAALAVGCTSSSIPLASFGPGQGRLTVDRRVDVRHEMYIEGFVWYIRVDGRDGKVFEQRVEGERLTFALDPGRYQLTSYVRPCDANCGNLDKPRDRCSAAFDLVANSGARAAVLIRPAHPCVISFDS